jgi:ubiquinol-cytochrome c reductase subunit 9
MGAADAVYNLFFKRSTLYIPFVLVGAFFANEAVDKAVSTVWESNNRGVSLERGRDHTLTHARVVFVARCRRRRPTPVSLRTRALTPSPALSHPTTPPQKLFKDLPTPASSE